MDENNIPSTWQEKILKLAEESKKHKFIKSFDLNELAFQKLKECKSKNKIISFPAVFEKLCVCFSIKKINCWKLLRRFEDEEKIEIIPYHGIRILE